MIAPRRLYDFLPSGNGYRVRMALAELELPFEYVQVDLLRAQSHTPEFLAKNPAGEIPVLELEDGTYLRESNAILCYLCEGTSLWPSGAVSRARAFQWMFFEQSNIDRVIGRARFRRRWPNAVATSTAEFERWYEHGYRALSVMEQHLAQASYFVDDRFGVADITLYAYTHCAEEGGFDLSLFPGLLAWFERVRARPKHVRIDALPAVTALPPTSP